MSDNHRRKHAESSKSETCDLEASSSSNMSLIREDARNALCPPPKTTRRRSSRREHDRKRPEKGNGGRRDGRKAADAMSMDVSMSRSARCQPSKRTSRRSSSCRKHERSRPEKGRGGDRDRDRRKTETAESTDGSVATPSPNMRRRSKHRDVISSRDSPLWDRSTTSCRYINDEEERRGVVEKEIKHVKKNAKVDHCQYDSMSPTSKRLDHLSGRKHRRHAHKIDEEQYVSSSSPVHNKLESSDLLWDGSRTSKFNIEEERPRAVVEKEIRHVKKDHCEYDSSESASKRLDSSNRKHGHHAHKINEEQYVSSSSPMHNKLRSSEYYKNDKTKSMHGGSPGRSKQLVVHRNNGRNKNNRTVADHRTYIGPSMFLDDSTGRSFARRMVSERPRRDEQWKEGRLKRLKNKMAIIFHHHHHHHHHRHGRLVEVLERLARYVWRPEKGVAGRRRGGSGPSVEYAKRQCLWWRRGGGGGGVKVGRRRQPVLLLNRRRSQKKLVSLGDKKGKRS